MQSIFDYEIYYSHLMYFLNEQNTMIALLIGIVGMAFLILFLLSYLFKTIFNNDQVQNKNSAQEFSHEEDSDESDDQTETEAPTKPLLVEKQEAPAEFVEKDASTSNTTKSAAKEYNILLLGETGAGKSTTINAFANYLKFSTFEEASAGEFIHLIPSKFTLPDRDNGEPIVIQSGNDANEVHREGGYSCTQSPCGYTFELGDKLIRIIDTPGMGDTRGIDMDKENFEKILNYLHYHQTLHGICILIKTNETRRTTSFRYCISELLAYLHKSACKNIVFCFTFSRNSFYGPGEGFTTLKGFLNDELGELKFEMKAGQNCFFVDNEAFRYLVAKKQGYEFRKNQEEFYQESWNSSVEQANIMINHILQLEAHNLDQTSSLNNARKLIIELAEPMVRLQNSNSKNIEKLESERLRLNTSTETKENLARSLHIEVDDLKLQHLDMPTTVCTSKKCTELIDFNGEQKINYKTQCHVGCNLTSVETNCIGHPSLKTCWAMDSTENCARKCGCSWKVHMHLNFEFVKVKRILVDKNKEREIKNTEDAISNIQQHIDRLERLILEFQEELEVIRDISSKFAYILNSNSSTPYNKFLEPYLNLLIEEEAKKLNAIPNYSFSTYNSLVEMLDDHKIRCDILTDAIRSNKSDKDVHIADIGHYRDKLLKLEHCGPQFRQFLSTIEMKRGNGLNSSERIGNQGATTTSKKSNLQENIENLEN